MEPIKVVTETEEKIPLKTLNDSSSLYIDMVTKPFWVEPNLRWGEKREGVHIISCTQSFGHFRDKINIGVLSYSLIRGKIDIECI